MSQHGEPSSAGGRGGGGPGGGLVGWGPGCPPESCRGSMGAGSSATKRDSTGHRSPPPPRWHRGDCRSVARGQLIAPGLCSPLPSSQSWTGAVTLGPPVPGCRGPIGDTSGGPHAACGVAAAGRGTARCVGRETEARGLRGGQRPGGAGTALPGRAAEPMAVEITLKIRQALCCWRQ